MVALQIGLTGGIGAGKSLIGRIFQTLGIPVYDADSRAKSVMTTDGILISNIKKEFGELSFHPDGSINRRYLSELVFQDSKRLGKLNELVHPRVAKDYQEWVTEHVQYEYVVKEAALLFESGSYKQLDHVILVIAPEELRVERVARRDRERSRDQIRQIMAQQMSDKEKMKLADAVVWNDESRLVIPQVLELHERFSLQTKHQTPS